MRSWSGWCRRSSWLLLLALLLQLVFLSSVFDVYFSSPVLEVDVSHRCPSRPPPARRLVVFVADGLRAHSFFELSRDDVFGLYKANSSVEGETSESLESSFLRSKMSEGVFGVSHTRLPTESRPGHVAIMAGMYEDPSAITRGWKTNPVSFDTVFNASRLTFSWGSPDILPMFGDVVSHMHMEMYDAAMESFAAEANISSLDTWVFDRVVDMFDRATHGDEQLRAQLRSDELILFLHLLGCDTTGHAHKPHSSHLESNVHVVDAGVRRVVQTMEQYYREDGRTTYLFTADHGMTDWGSHGAASDHETMTPLVLWGAGVRSSSAKHKSLAPSVSAYFDHVSPKSWAINDSLRVDVAQADLAPLMASLLGISVPKNSVGQLPLELLDLHPSHLVQAHLSVSRQILEQFNTLKRQFELLWPSIIFHKPFRGDAESDNFDMKLMKINRLLSRNYYTDALQLSQEVHALGLKGLHYYLHYYRHQLYFVISSSYLIFILLLLLELATLQGLLVPLNSPLQSQMRFRRVRVNQVFVFLAIVVVLMTWMQDVPYHYFIYHMSPVLLLWLLTRRSMDFHINVRVKLELKSTVIKLIIILFVLETMIMAFFDRRWLSVALFVIAMYRRHWASVVLNILLSLFPLMPTIGNSDNSLLVLTATVLTSLSHLSKCKVSLVKSIKAELDRKLLVLLIINVTCGVSVVVADSSLMLWSSWCRPLMHLISWTSFFTALPVALWCRRSDEDDNTQMCLYVSVALLSMHALLSVSYENLFLLILNHALEDWMKRRRPERSHVVLNSSYTESDSSDTLLLLFYSVLSFFGTGNLASLNSFDPSSLRALVTTFNPFLMGFLLLLKVLIPFQLVALYSSRKLEGEFHTLILLLLSQLMSLHFFFLVTDQGSWLDIGTSLSHFVISQATTFFLNIFLWISTQILSPSAKGAKKL